MPEVINPIRTNHYIKQQNMRVQKIVFLIVMLISNLVAHAQNEYLVAANKYFANADYFSAAQYYEKYLAGGKSKGNAGTFSPYAVSAVSNKSNAIAASTKEQIIYNLAESYRKLNYHEKALPYYQQATGFNPAVYPYARFYYAGTLKALARYEESEKEFTGFLSTYSTNDIYRESAEREVASLKFIQQQLAKNDLSKYTINKAEGLNAEGGTYAATWMNNSTILFTSTRPDATDKSKAYTNRIYQANYDNGAVSNISKTAIEQPRDIHQGAVAVTPSGNTIFFSRWTVGNGKKTASIFRSDMNNGKWSDPVQVDALNASGFNSQQPFVMPDGKQILFSSDKAGGQGGFDLYSADLDASGNVSNAVNLGSGINTKFDEQAPFYHEASSTLVFSSNGRVGMGGFDFYSSKGMIGSFQEPVNFGYPVNSIKDDLYFVSRGPARNILETVLLSSDRDAACCLEMFSLNKTKALKTISGTVVACDTRAPLAGVTVNIIDTINNRNIAVKTTDASGNYSFTIEDFQPLKATATQSGYFTNSIRFNSPSDTESETMMNAPLCLELIPEAPIRVENVYYDFNKATLKVESYPSLDELVKLLNDNPTMSIELSAHTDSKGTDEYNNKLSDTRAQSVVDYLVSKGIDRSRLVAKGYGESQPVEPNTKDDGSDNPEGREKNRRTEFKVLKN